MSKWPIIFYDVDGVMNTFTTPEQDKANGVGAVLSVPHVERLLAIRNATAGLLVCVSSWRKHENGIAALKAYGIWDGLFTEYDNPALPTRAHEVQDFLDWSPAKDRKFVVLDDSRDKYDPNMIAGWHMPIIASDLGLQDADMDSAIEYLKA